MNLAPTLRAEELRKLPVGAAIIVDRSRPGTSAHFLAVVTGHGTDGLPVARSWVPHPSDESRSRWSVAKPAPIVMRIASRADGEIYGAGATPVEGAPGQKLKVLYSEDIAR